MKIRLVSTAVVPCGLTDMKLKVAFRNFAYAPRNKLSCNVNKNFPIEIIGFLCFVDHASLYNLVNKTNMVHNFS